MNCTSLAITGRELGTQLMVSERRPELSRFILASFSEDFGYMNKPLGGLWTSSLDNGISDWIRWCRVESFGAVDDKAWWHLTPDPEAQVLRIDASEDFHLVMETYGRVLSWSFHHHRQAIDFDAVLRDGYDGVNLTDRGAMECRFGGSFTGMDLNAWDCESTVWLRWAFTSVMPASESERRCGRSVAGGGGHGGERA